jgi:predicted enzyme related to lactoylglutathione lyase
MPPTDAPQSTPITLGAVNVAADDPVALAAFWGAVLGVPVPPPLEGPIVFLAPRPPHGFGMFFQRRGAPRSPGQDQHLDLTVPWGSREAEVRRVVALGATHRWDVLEEVPWVRWSTVADPEGNLFCLAEHPPADG